MFTKLLALYLLTYYLLVYNYRCRIWINNLQLDLNVNDVRRKKKICAEHFSNASFRTSEKDKLNRNAQPTIFHANVRPLLFPNIESVQLPSSRPAIEQRKGHESLIIQPSVSGLGFSTCPEKQKRDKKTCDLLRIKNFKLRQLKFLCKKRKHLIKKLQKRDIEILVEEILKGCNNSIFLNLLLTQIKFKYRKPRGRRWSLKDKTIALSLYKRSPKAYRLLQSFTPLPSRVTLMSLLFSIPFKPGICSSIFEHLKQNIEKMNIDDRICSLIYDEMSLKQHLEYDSKNDVIGLRRLWYRKN